MVGFTQALGVRCVHCHVGEEGRPLTAFDFPSDAKPSKLIARGMVRMLEDIRKDLNKMPLNRGNRRVEVQCVTCHHGKPRPTTLADELTVVYERAGIDSALVLYRSLRERYYGRDVYDFGDAGLGPFAAALAAKGRNDDAIRGHQWNLEQNPRSIRANMGLAQALEGAGRKQEAADVYRKILEIDPENAPAKRRLSELQGSGK
jgi:tetratricopeptide (TPR) repeat protein